MKRPGTTLRIHIVFAATIGLALLVEPAAETAAQPVWAKRVCTCSGCLLVETDQSLVDGALEEEAQSLVDTLAIRLGRKGIMVMAELEGGTRRRIRRPKGSAAAQCKSGSGQQQWFVVHLQDLSEDTLLVALDYMGSHIEDDMVREVEKGPDPAATAWTLALMLEDALSPYLDASKDSPAIGAGLAIIEPPEIGGGIRRETKNEEEDVDPGLRLSGVALGAGSYYSPAATDALLGPHLSVRADLGRRFRISIGAGWLGIAEVEKKNVDISIHHLPMEVLAGAVFFASDVVEIIASGGLSAVLTTYETSSALNTSRTTLFAPWLSAKVELIFEVYGPFCAGVHAAGVIPLVRDELQGDGRRVYRQDWAMPKAGVDLVYRLY